jgi:hypothetical protein
MSTEIQRTERSNVMACAGKAAMAACVLAVVFSGSMVYAQQAPAQTNPPSSEGILYQNDPASKVWNGTVQWDRTFGGAASNLFNGLVGDDPTSVVNRLNTAAGNQITAAGNRKDASSDRFVDAGKHYWNAGVGAKDAGVDTAQAGGRLLNGGQKGFRHLFAKVPASISHVTGGAANLIEPNKGQQLFVWSERSNADCKNGVQIGGCFVTARQDARAAGGHLLDAKSDARYAGSQGLRGLGRTAQGAGDGSLMVLHGGAAVAEEGAIVPVAYGAVGGAGALEVLRAGGDAVGVSATGLTIGGEAADMGGAYGLRMTSKGNAAATTVIEPNGTVTHAMTRKEMEKYVRQHPDFLDNLNSEQRKDLAKFLAGVPASR